MVNIPDNQPDAVGPNWNVLCLGVPAPTEPKLLAPGISLKPLSFQLSEFDLMAAAAMGFREGFAIAQLARYCTVEIESASDAAVTPGYDALNRVWLATSLLVIRGHWACMPIAASNYSWTRIRKPTPGLSLNESKQTRTDLPNYQATILEYRLKILGINDQPPSQVDSDDIIWINNHYDRFNILCATEESFRFSLQCCVDWRYLDDSRSALARLWQGVESILRMSAELTHRISISAASILEPRGPKELRAASRLKSYIHLEARLFTATK